MTTYVRATGTSTHAGQPVGTSSKGGKAKRAEREAPATKPGSEGRRLSGLPPHMAEAAGRQGAQTHPEVLPYPPPSM